MEWLGCSLLKAESMCVGGRMFGKWLPEILVHSCASPKSGVLRWPCSSHGPKSTVHYPGMRPGEDNKQQKQCRMESAMQLQKSTRQQKSMKQLFHTEKCLPDVLLGKKNTRKCRSVCEMSPLTWKNKIHVICLYLQRLFLQESLSSG